MAKGSIFKMLAATAHGKGGKAAREVNDFYSTDPKAVEDLLRYVQLQNHVTEPSCGNGNIAKVLVSHGHTVNAFDLIDRGYGAVKDFLTDDTMVDGDIVMNPPYQYALEHILHGLQVLKNGNKLCAFLKVQFLESQKRKPLFDQHPPKYVYVFRKRANSYRNDDRTCGGGAVCYCWYIWEKGYTGEPVIRWID